MKQNIRTGPSRHSPQNQRVGGMHQNDARSQTSFPMQVMIPGQRPSYMTGGHGMSITQRPMRSRPMYSQSPQGHSPMQGFIPQQNVQYQVVGQDPYGQPVMRPAYIPNVPQYQMQPTSAPFQPQFMPQQAQYFNQGMPQAMYYMQPNQQIQQPQQQQQQPTQTQTQNTAIQTNNINKSKPKRSSKIVIRDPKDNKDVTEEILHSNTANGRTGSTPPLTNSTVQTDSSKIQAQFAAQVAARVGGEKGKQINEKKAEDTGKDKDGQASTAQIDETKREKNIQGNGSIVTNESCAKDVPQNNMEISNKVNSIAEENRTGSPKGTTDNTHANQSSPTLGEMTAKMKMTIESQKETRNEKPKVVLKRADRETTTKSEGSETTTKSEGSETTTKSEGSETTTKSEGSETKEVADVSVPMSQNNENTVERKTSKVVVHSPVEQTKNEDKGDSLDNGQNDINVSKTPESNETLSEMTSDKTKKRLETITDTEGDAKEGIGMETGSKQEDIAQIQEEIVKPNESHGELLSQPEVTKQETTEQQDEEVAEQEQNKLSQVEKQPELIQADKKQQIRQAEKEQEFEVVKQQEQQIDKQQQQQQSDKQQEKQSDKQQQQQSDRQQEKQSDKQQQQNDKQQEKQSDKQQQQADKQQQQQTEKQQQQQQTRQPDKKPDNPKPQQQEKQPQQSQKPAEPPKKKSSKQRFKDINKKETGGDLMDAYTDKPPPQEVVVEEKAKPVEVVAEKSEKPLEEDLSWEDKEEKIGEEIKVENETEPEPAGPVELTTRKYDRDFLLQFQFIPVCTEKPAGLPNIEVVLDSPTPQNKSGGSQRSGSDFLPSYARQKSQGGGGRRDSRGKPQARKIITAAPAPPVVLKQSENRWLRPEEKEKQLSEDEKKTAELYRNVVAILNKLTPQKFKTLVEQIMALSIDTSERLEGVIDRIFEKAISEPVFSVAYANMCRCLFGIKVADAEGKDVSFRKLLLNRCQKEFEKEKEDEQALLDKFSHLEEGLSEEEKKVKKEEMDEALAKNKRRMLGNIKFIGELFKLKLLTENIMHDCIFKLLRAGDEESLESMCKLLFTIGKDLDTDKAKPRIEQYFDQIGKVISAKKISSRVIFMLRDVVELRVNKWVPRREDNYNPKTIDQIHKEAQMEKMQEQRLAAQMPVKDNKQKKGGSGGRDSPKPTSNDGWITTGKGGKNAPIDQNKLRNMAKRAHNEEISLGPSSRFGQWGRGSSAGLNNSSQEQEQPQGNRYSALSGGGDMPSSRPYDPRKPSSGSRPSSAGSRGSDKSRIKNDKGREAAIEAARALHKSQQAEKSEVVQPPEQPANQEKQEVKETKESKQPVKEPAKEPVKEPLSEDELVKKTTALIDEYANIRDLKEAVTCFTDLHSPELHHLFILTAVEHTYEMSPRARHDSGELFAELLSQNKLNKKQLVKGFNSVLELAYDNAIDYPMLWKYLAEIITPVIVKDLFTLSDLKPLILQHLIPVGKAAALFAEILLMTNELKGENKTIQIWKDLGITWSEVLPERLTQEEFLSRKNLNFLPSKNNDELLQLLRAADDELKNDTVFAHIEKHFKEDKRKEAPFICELVTAVAESCIINKERDGGPDCCQDKLKARKDILRKYLDNNNILQLEALFAIQKIYVKYNKPADMLLQFFNTLYDEEVITEEAFMTWKRDENPSRQEAKGPALQATTSFFEWLQAATIEGGEN